MAKTPYLPNTDGDRVIWFNNFSTRFAVLATSPGFVAADATAVTNDAAMFAYLMGQVETFTTAKEQRVQYKNLIKEGPLGKAGGTIPSGPVVPAAPAVVLPGVFPRLAQMVQRIKNFPAYTEAMGKDLGIIGPEQTTDTDTMKPIVKLVSAAGQIQVQWPKGNADALRIESDKGAGWQFLAIDSIPDYTDTTPVTAPATWKYRARYIIADEPVGQWSDVVSINV